jgi:AraC-like DNA-binding protein
MHTAAQLSDMGGYTSIESLPSQSQDWLSFIDACQVAIGKSQLESSEGSPALIPVLLEAAGRLHTRAGRLLGRVVIFRIASRLNRTVGPADSVPPAYLLEDSHPAGRLASSYHSRGTGDNDDSSGVDSRVAQVLNYVRACHLQPDCRLADIAQNLRMSRSHLSRLVLKQTGVTFKGHLQLARMNTAARLLQETNLSIKEIASSTGYEHVPSFDRQFRHYFQVTPGRFRRLTGGLS